MGPVYSNTAKEGRPLPALEGGNADRNQSGTIANSLEMVGAINHGVDVFDVLDKKASPAEVEYWFVSTPRERWIEGLIETINSGWWGYPNFMSSLILHDRNFSPQEIINLLQGKPRGFSTHNPIIHLLVIRDQTSTLIPLLDALVRASPQDLLPLVQLKDTSGLNVLSCACKWNRPALLQFLFNHLEGNVSSDLFAERGDGGKTGLHTQYQAACCNHSIRKVLSLLNDEKKKIHYLLSGQDDQGRTVLAHSIHWGNTESFGSILQHYVGNRTMLLELAAIPDEDGKTSFHHAVNDASSDFFLPLLKAAYSLETRAQLSNALRTPVMRRNGDVMHGLEDRGSKPAEKCHSSHQLTYDWVLNSLDRKRYLLFNMPSVLVLYNTFDQRSGETGARDGADEEAKSIIQCLEKLDFCVQHRSSFTKEQLFHDIVESQKSETSRNGQIVVLMSHGCEGYIEACDGKLIALRDIEHRMCPDSHVGIPKLLILQCCQNLTCADEGSSSKGKRNQSSINTPTLTTDPRSTNAKLPSGSYAPSHADFCSLVSTCPGVGSERNEFIPKLAQAITDMEIGASMSEVMDDVKSLFPVKLHEQAPGCLDLFKYKFCMKSILPIYLKIKHDEVGTNEKLLEASSSEEA